MDLTKEQRDAFLASATQAEAARIIGTDGKRFRTITRGALGVYVSQDGAWDARTKAFRLALVLANDVDTRKAIVAAFKAGDATPPKA